MTQVKEPRNATLVTMVRLAKESLGAAADLEAVRVWVLANHPDALLNSSQVRNAQYAALAKALKANQGGLPWAYPTRHSEATSGESEGTVIYWQRDLFEASDYILTGSRLILANRRNTHRLDLLIGEANARGFIDVTYDACAQRADESDHTEDDEDAA